jgi:hypothetical protein
MDASAKLMLRICPGEGEMVQTSLRSMAQLWERNKAKPVTLRNRGLP